MYQIQFISLPGERKLSYYEFGDRQGHPVFYFHGAPSSALEPLLIGEEIFLENKLRIISINRPGISDSDFQPNRSFSDWPNDVTALADHLGIDKFSVVGNSGGGGYVTVCAAKIPHRLISAVIFSGGWHMSFRNIRKHLSMPYKAFWMVSSKLPFLLPFALRSMRSKPGESIEKQMEQAKKMMPAADFEALSKNNRAAILSAAVDESLKNIKGTVHDLRMYVKPWDFDISTISFPIHLIHGDLDKNFPLSLVKEFVQKIPAARLYVQKDEAHLSTLCNHFDKALAYLFNDKTAGNPLRVADSRS